MDYKSKYIIVKQGAITIPVVFGDLANHKDVARGFMPGVIIGAGFCQVDERTSRYVCYGRSNGLNIGSNGDADSAILNKFLGVEVNYD